ncbi:MAG: MotA/TolQ/ExbB proton channel family protein [Phenylobacterium sp.]
MPKFKASLACAVVTAFAALPAFAQDAPPDAPFTHVAAADRLTLGAIFSHAGPINQVVLWGLLAAALGAAAAWAVQTARVHQGRSAGLPGAMAYLSGLSAAGPLIGFFGALYSLLDSAIGVANVRPVPSLSILAPGIAEGALCAALGLLAAAIAVIGHRHLKLQLYRLDQTNPVPAASVSRQARAAI